MKLFKQSIYLLSIFTFFNTNLFSQYSFEYATPDSKGFSYERFDSLKNKLSYDGSSSMLILVDGKIIFEWGETSKKHLVHSIRKSLINSLYGLSIAKGQIDTSMTLRELGIDDIYKLSNNELNARVVDLLKSRSGVYHTAGSVTKYLIKNKPERDTYLPGEHFYYNNWDFNVLGAILEQQTGKSLYTLFLEEVATPLGMHDYEGVYMSVDRDSVSRNSKIPDINGLYLYEKNKSKYPAYHFRLTTKDLALFGQLYLNNGKWNDKQILTKEWIEISTKPYSVYDDDYGVAYGMLWRVLYPNKNRSTKAFFHTGMGVHLLGVFPEYNMVIIHRVDTEGNFNYRGNIYRLIDFVIESKLN